ncbi:hypothetical protein [Streptomyces harbinensis]|uniref:hypothetical protein n=1 Tax=Streptomyces harbinensis TaxID=1176198 RepID=UPI0036B21288
MVFDTRVLAEQHAADPPFEWIGLDGETYQLPPMRLLTPRQVAAFEQAETVNGVLDLLRAIAPDAAEAAADLPIGVMEDLMSSWRRTTGGEAGKSPSRSSAKKRAGKPPKRT